MFDAKAPDAPKPTKPTTATTSHQDTTNDDLQLYVCDDPTCTTGTNQTLETTDDVGWSTSVAIRADGNPIISHRDDTNGDLELYVGPATTYTIAFE